MMSTKPETGKVTLQRVTDAAADEAARNYVDFSDRLSYYASELTGYGDGGYVVIINGVPAGAVWRDSAVGRTYGGAWKGTGRVSGHSRAEAVQDVVSRHYRRTA